MIVIVTSAFVYLIGAERGNERQVSGPDREEYGCGVDLECMH